MPCGWDHCVILSSCLFFLSLCSNGFQDLLRLNPPSLLMLFGCISSSMASMMRRSMWPCLWYNMLSISSFQFFISFCCAFIKFDTKFDSATLLGISFLHFRDVSLLHENTQFAIKSDVLMLTSWNSHWSASKNVCLGWCLGCGYSVASFRATHSVSLLSWRITYMFRQYRVIFRELVINNLPSYTSISNAAVANTIYN